MEGSIELARFAIADGTHTVVATPHIREDYPFALEQIAARVDQLSGRLARAGFDLAVETGGEIGLAMLTQLDDATLTGLCLGSSRSLLVESPYQDATDLLEQALFDVQMRGFGVVLAHPERSPSFMRDPDRLQVLVERGVLCSVTAASMAGRFGRTVQRFSRLMFERRLVHDVASDAHDIRRRSPGLTAGFRLLNDELPGILDEMDWFTRTAPSAILDGVPLPLAPQFRKARRRLFS